MPLGRPTFWFLSRLMCLIQTPPGYGLLLTTCELRPLLRSSARRPWQLRAREGRCNENADSCCAPAGSIHVRVCGRLRLSHGGAREFASIGSAYHRYSRVRESDADLQDRADAHSQCCAGVWDPDEV